MKRDLIFSALTWSVFATTIIFIVISLINSSEVVLYNLLGSLFAAVSIPLAHSYRKLKGTKKGYIMFCFEA
jgi:hypothetical protein